MYDIGIVPNKIYKLIKVNKIKKTKQIVDIT